VRQALPQNWSSGTLPPYFAANDWARVIYYAVARNALEDRGAACTACKAESLSVDASSGHDVVLISTGYASAARSGTAPIAYIDDAENNDGDERFITPPAAGADRDRLYSILASESGCAANARVLIDNVPCASAGGVRPVCQSASAALARCTCSGAAAVLTKLPCAASPGTAACEIAMTQLRGCLL
jgi:hypothetical protein